MSYDNLPPPTYIAPSQGISVLIPYGMQTGLNIHAIRDYLAWSLINLFCGWGIGGFIPLIFSILCRNSKSTNDYSGAQTMSTLALVANIIITIAGVIG
jgi:hypothetical protein